MRVVRVVSRRRRIGAWTVAATVLAVALGFARHRLEAQDNAERVARGKYLVDSVAACGQCHTPRRGAEEDMARYLAGHPATGAAPKFAMELIREGVFISVSPTFTAFSGPWGSSFASNLTPDPNTGLGNWTEEQFIGAMRTGKHTGDPNKRAILPPMPWKHYQRMSEDDLRAIWAYLRSIDPVNNAVPEARNQFGNPLD